MTDTQDHVQADTTSARPPNAHPCSCGAWWTGLTRAHCPACHRTFSVDSAADKHRKGRHGIDRHCVDPSTVGLVPVDKPYGVLWQNPGIDGDGWFKTAPTEPKDA